MRRLLRAFTTVSLFLGICAGAVAGSSEISFVLDGVRQEFIEVSAFRIRDRSDPKSMNTLVLLTKTAPDRAAIASADDAYAVAINDTATEDDYLALVIKKDGTVGLNASIGEVQYLDSSGEIFGKKGSLTADCSKNSPQRVACVVKTEKNVITASDASWSLSAVFESEVLSREPGRPIESDGGQPGKTLLALNKARKGDEIEPILTWLDEAIAQDFRADWRSAEENLSAVKEALDRMIPQECTIVEGEYRGDDAVTILVKGTIESWGEDELIFEAYLQRSGEKWLLNRGKFVGIVD